MGKYKAFNKNLDETILDDINSERTWYLAGILACLNKGINNDLIIIHRNQSLLEYVKKSMHADNKLISFGGRVAKNGRVVGTTSKKFQIKNMSYLSERMKEVGIDKPREERRLEGIRKVIPEKYEPTLLRAIYETMGSTVVINKESRVILRFQKLNKDFLVDTKNLIKEYVPLNSGDSIFPYIYVGGRNISDFRDLIYDDATITIPNSKEKIYGLEVKEKETHSAKIDLAKKILINNPGNISSLKEVSEMSGFPNYNVFAYFFKKNCGEPPSFWAQSKGLFNYHG